MIKVVLYCPIKTLTKTYTNLLLRPIGFTAFNLQAVNKLSKINLDR